MTTSPRAHPDSSSLAPTSGASIAPVEEIVADLRAGKMVILVDEEDRENEGDLMLAAEHVTPEAINFMATHARGLVCLTLTRERCQELGLAPMASRNGTRYVVVGFVNHPNAPAARPALDALVEWAAALPD